MGRFSKFAADEGEYRRDVDRLVGVRLEDRPASGNWLAHLIVPKLVGGADGVEVAGVPSTSPLAVSPAGGCGIATAKDLDHESWQSQ